VSEPSLLGRLIRAVADRLANHPSIPEQNRETFKATAALAIEAELRSHFGGEQVRLYIPKFGGETRKARDERITAAIAAGEAAPSVAKRESVSERHVRRVRGRIGGF
jgi:Mor family transcriptional regulator